MNYLAMSSANSAAAPLGPTHGKKKNSGNFKLRSGVSKLVKSLTVAGIAKTSDRRRTVHPKRRAIKGLKKRILKSSIRRRIGVPACRRLRHKSAALAAKRTNKPAIQLLTHGKLNSDFDRIPDSEALQQAKAFSQSSNDLAFVLSKVRYHTENEGKLSERSKLIWQLQKTPDSPKMQEDKNKLDKQLASCPRELNEVLLSGFLSKARDLLREQSENDAIIGDLAKLLGDEDKPNKFSLSEFTDSLTKYLNRAAKKKARAAGAA